jgi:hypothetical protein
MKMDSRPYFVRVPPSAYLPSLPRTIVEVIMGGLHTPFKPFNGHLNNRLMDMIVTGFNEVLVELVLLDVVSALLSDDDVVENLSDSINGIYETVIYAIEEDEELRSIVGEDDEDGTPLAALICDELMSRIVTRLDKVSTSIADELRRYPSCVSSLNVVISPEDANDGVMVTLGVFGNSIAVRKHRY